MAAKRATIVAVMGMTHLGLVTATAIASKGFETVCYDTDSDLIGKLRKGLLPVAEPVLDELLESNCDIQKFTDNLEEIARCDLVYIAADVPTNDEDCSDMAAISSLTDQAMSVLGENSIMVVLSQVEPGFTRTLSGPSPERRFYQVETLIFGRAVARATAPERYIVGCNDPSSPLPHAFQEVLDAFDCPILPMRYESAELAKISINFCLVSSISVANTLAEICESIGADWSEIVPALKLDRRIGAYSYLVPGLGIAGGNLERDLATIQKIGKAEGTDTGVVAAWKTNSRHRRDWATKAIKSLLLDEHPEATVAVWGLAYKENTDSIKNSPSLATLSQITTARLRLHDPVVSSDVVDHVHKTQHANPLETVMGADALMILTPWPEYAAISLTLIREKMSGSIILDPYRVFDAEEATKLGFTYRTLGS